MTRLWSSRLSPYAGKARAAFAEKGVAIDLAEVRIGPVADRPQRLRDLNPAGRVPVLELDDGLGIPESTVICEWLEDTHPSPALWPADAALRARGRAWLRWLDDELVRPFFLGMRRLAFENPTDPAAVDADIRAKLDAAWPVLEEALGVHDGPWLFGEDFSYADLGGLAIAVRLPEWRADLQPSADDLPLVAGWLDALRARPSASAIDARGEKLSEVQSAP